METADLHSMHLAVLTTDVCNKCVMVTDSSSLSEKKDIQTPEMGTSGAGKKVIFLANSEMTDKETIIFFCACTNASLRERSHSFCVIWVLFIQSEEGGK